MLKSRSLRIWAGFRIDARSQNVPRNSEANEDERNGRGNIDKSLQDGIISCCQSGEESEICNRFSLLSLIASWKGVV